MQLTLGLEHVVTDDAVVIELLSVVVFTGASWENSAGSVALNAVIEPMVQVKSSMTKEGDLAYVIVYAEFDDGQYEDVTDEVKLSVTDNSGSLSFLDDTTLEVNPGAVSLTGPAILAEWKLCNSTITGTGVVMLDMPSATSIELTGKPKIAKAGDGATYVPFEVPDSVSWSVVVHFEDGSSQDYSADSRASFTFLSDGADSLVAMDGNVMSALDDAALYDDDENAVVMMVSFPSLFKVSANATINVVEFASLAVTTRPWPEIAESGYQDAVVLLRPFGGSGVFQRLEARAVGTLSDGTVDDSASFYQLVPLVSSNLAVAQFSSSPCAAASCRGLVPAVPGTTTVTGSFGGVNASVLITVGGDPISLVRVGFVDDLANETTLTGLVGHTHVLSTELTFSDGSVITAAASGQVTSGWLDPELLLRFASDNPEVVNVSATGVLTLFHNSYSTVAITAVDNSGDTNTSATIDVYANLEPEVYDVDLGNRYGAPFGTATTGETFDVNVRIEASSAQPLKAYQIVIMFNDSLVQVNNDDDCVQGDGWSSSWECTANDPIDEVLMVGSCVSDCGTTDNLDIGTIAFQVLSSGVNTFTAYIVKIKDDVTTTEQLYMFAGKDILVISDVGHRLMPHVPQPGEDRAPMRLPERLSGDCGGNSSIPGDTNADCAVDVEDVEYLQFYIVGIVSESELTATQLKWMDVDVDGDIDIVDIGFDARRCVEVSVFDEVQVRFVAGLAAFVHHSRRQWPRHGGVNIPCAEDWHG